MTDRRSISGSGAFTVLLVGVAMERGTVTVRSWLEGSVNGLLSYIFFVFYDRFGMVNGALREGSATCISMALSRVLK